MLRTETRSNGCLDGKLDQIHVPIAKVKSINSNPFSSYILQYDPFLTDLSSDTLQKSSLVYKEKDVEDRNQVKRVFGWKVRPQSHGQRDQCIPGYVLISGFVVLLLRLSKIFVA